MWTRLWISLNSSGTQPMDPLNIYRQAISNSRSSWMSSEASTIILEELGIILRASETQAFPARELQASRKLEADGILLKFQIKAVIKTMITKCLHLNTPNEPSNNKQTLDQTATEARLNEWRMVCRRLRGRSMRTPLTSLNWFKTQLLTLWNCLISLRRWNQCIQDRGLKHETTAPTKPSRTKSSLKSSTSRPVMDRKVDTAGIHTTTRAGRWTWTCSMLTTHDNTAKLTKEATTGEMNLNRWLRWLSGARSKDCCSICSSKSLSSNRSGRTSWVSEPTLYLTRQTM